MISEGVSWTLILKILGIKVLMGIVLGFIIDFLFNRLNKNDENKNKIHDICEHEHCHCEEGIIKSTLKHTINIFIYIFIFSLVLNIAIELIGTDKIESIISSKPFLGSLVACAIGLIPNCASSVILTEMYLTGILNLGMMIGGLLINAGVGLLVLFRVNKHQKENILIVISLYLIGVISAMILQNLTL